MLVTERVGYDGVSGKNDNNLTTTMKIYQQTLYAVAVVSQIQSFFSYQYGHLFVGVCVLFFAPLFEETLVKKPTNNEMKRIE